MGLKACLILEVPLSEAVDYINAIIEPSFGIKVSRNTPIIFRGFCNCHQLVSDLADGGAARMVVLKQLLMSSTELVFFLLRCLYVSEESWLHDMFVEALAQSGEFAQENLRLKIELRTTESERHRIVFTEGELANQRV
ncbi:hypothetical protein ACFE04_020064 [Oxalis oulophora]